MSEITIEVGKWANFNVLRAYNGFVVEADFHVLGEESKTSQYLTRVFVARDEAQLSVLLTDIISGEINDRD